MNQPLLVSLIGLPGGGKTSVGRQLARRLACAFVDTDAAIEHELREPIRAFFEREGEGAFRDIEERVLARLIREHRGVLATGGGIVLRERNRQALRSGTSAVYLRSSPEELARRLRHDTKRPLLQVPNPLAKLRELHAVRDPLYRETAHFIVETGRPTIHSLVNMILMQLELAGRLDAGQVPSPVDGGRPGGGP